MAGVTGPNFFPMTNPNVLPVTYSTVVGSNAFTTWPVDCRGGYDKTIMVCVTSSFPAPTTGVNVVSISAAALINVQVSIDPEAVVSPAAANWYSIGNITSSPTALFHSGLIRAMRVVVTTVTAGDQYSVVYMIADRG